ncbi:MAG: phosphatidylserine decarboxylase [Proteobacteria bacterium]|nr:phosphatidylserine decarboxylase [Pseudomonadota bacterium]
MNLHQYIERDTGKIITEKLIGDRSVRLLYNPVREHAPTLFKALTSARMSSMLGWLHFDAALERKQKKGTALFAKMGVNWQECLDPPDYFDTPRKIFERQIRYWQVRPMENDPRALVSPADARVLIGSLEATPELFIKEKFFSALELLGRGWGDTFHHGDFAVFRLTPDKYHYNHLPVSGKVIDIYELDGAYHSCNPAALVTLASVHAKNKRVVTIIDTDVENGTGAGLVAMIEVVALMIGDIVQCYSRAIYEDPVPVRPGMFVKKGCPKSLYRPGSSTDILLFQPGRMTFCDDLQRNVCRRDVQSRFSSRFSVPLAETDIKVRATVGRAESRNGHPAGNAER